MTTAYTYILQCANGQYYVGSTTHLKSLKGLESIDCGCCINNFSFLCKFDYDNGITGIEQMSVNHYYNNRSCKKVLFSKTENSLFTFFFQLNYYLKEIGTVPAIDINAYLKAVDAEIDVVKSDPLF